MKCFEINLNLLLFVIKIKLTVNMKCFEIYQHIQHNTLEFFINRKHEMF